jgi:hypothetical protein
MVVALAEAVLLTGYVGARLAGVVVDVAGDRATVQLSRPAVVAEIAAAGLALGDEIQVLVDGADPQARTVQLTPVG